MMANKAKTFGDELIAALEEALAHERGTIALPTKTVTWTERAAKVAPPPRYDALRIRAVRTSLNLSQAVFARTLGVSVATIRAWERGARIPDGPTRRLLQIAEEHPEALTGNIVYSEPLTAD